VKDQLPTTNLEIEIRDNNKFRDSCLYLASLLEAALSAAAPAAVLLLSIVTLVLPCRLSEILDRLYAKSGFFNTYPLFWSKFRGVALGVDALFRGLE